MIRIRWLATALRSWYLRCLHSRGRKIADVRWHFASARHDRTSRVTPALFGWRLRQGDPDEAIARHQRRKLFLVEALGPVGAHRQHDVAHVGIAVVHPDLGSQGLDEEQLASLVTRDCLVGV